MEAAQKADKEFGLTQRSGRHTIYDASSDIRKITLLLLEKSVTTPQHGRTGFHFQDATEEGFGKMTLAWLKRVLTPAPQDSTFSERQPLEENAMDYELHHVS